MKAQIKQNTTDKYLLPIRKQIIEMVQPNSSVLDFGCGNGDLLFKLSHKIKKGTGYDNSKPLISYANKRKSLEQLMNINFKLVDISKDSLPNNTVNYSLVCLFFHVISKKNALKLLQKMICISEVVIVCGFSKPETKKQSLLLYIDQRFSGHYSKFKCYRQNNYMEGILESLTYVNYKTISTFDPVIKIYKITKTKNNYE